MSLDFGRRLHNIRFELGQSLLSSCNTVSSTLQASYIMMIRVCDSLPTVMNSVLNSRFGNGGESGSGSLRYFP